MVDLPNGRLPDSELSNIEGVRLGKGTANAFRRMDEACAAATGVGLWPALPAGGYRDWAMQADIVNKNPDSSVPIAAPGSSTHGWGTRVDIGSFGVKWGVDGGKRAAWLLEHASEFGFHREFGAADPNHFAHDGFTATNPIITTAADTVTPITVPVPKEHGVNALTYKAPNGVIIRIGNGFKTSYESMADYEGHRRVIAFTKDYYAGKGIDTSDLDVPPAPQDVIGITWVDYEMLARVYGFTA